MKQKHVLVAIAVAVLLIAATLIGFRPHWAQRDATLSATQTQTQLPPCSGLEGRALERCQVMKQERPQDYEQGAATRGIDASSNSARAARGSGVEGVSSANTTREPPR